MIYGGAGRARMLAFASLVSVVVGAACAGSPLRSDDAPLGQPFELRVGASATFSGELTVAFDRVRSDSRCPLDVMCVQAGDAVVVVLLSVRSSAKEERELHTERGGSEISYRDYLVKLAALAPYPRASEPIRPQDYVATFIVTRR